MAVCVELVRGDLARAGDPETKAKHASTALGDHCGWAAEDSVPKVSIVAMPTHVQVLALGGSLP
jgi:hypothetical protein